MVNRYGVIPNGGRIYYLNRSQPPLLTPMIHEYFKATNDTDFIRENIALLEKEYQWWMENRIVEVFCTFFMIYHQTFSFICIPMSVANQNFQHGGGVANPSVLGKNLFFGNIFAEICIKMKEIGPRRGPVGRGTRP